MLRVTVAAKSSTHDEVVLCKLRLGIGLLDSAYQRSTGNGDDILMTTAKRYQVNTEKLEKAVAEEFAAKLVKKGKGKAEVPNKAV